MSRLFLVAIFNIFFCTMAFGNGEASFDKNMKPVLKHYLAIQAKLANDSTEGIQNESKAILKALKHVDAKKVKGKNADAYKNIRSDIEDLASKLAKSKGIVKIRKNFEKLSEPMVAWTKISNQSGIETMYCPMKKAKWVQKSGSTKNPYFGSSMLGCGSKI